MTGATSCGGGESGNCFLQAGQLLLLVVILLLLVVGDVVLDMSLPNIKYPSGSSEVGMKLWRRYS